ncbi:tRNA adenosine(34) deaminase TadA [Microbispora sp. H11081]|uniref:tRNA adenosine(34) deaminase TadA n=1 Tax=Microbispora sp. H11081 TaxID=2729107 RepID=UPI0028A0180F|nr:tRNA adenosine(34) deaminase TadA [Microbispora sp. H11081]
MTGSPQTEAYEAAMRLALGEAVRAGGRGEVPVGAVVLGPPPQGMSQPGAVLAVAGNDREASADPTAHAEVLALRAAAAATGDWRLTGCTLVVTLEPCTMCAGAAVLARVDRVVYGAVDEKAGAAGSLWDVLRDRRLNHRPEVVMGVLADECGAVLTEFFSGRRA